ncbi:MAG: hypothetical protein NZZ41_03355 [Candidatus Dojkabacteria bacterium]|nr:hypothetical protein [Candidatus Dojkabacteria bacterium]
MNILHINYGNKIPFQINGNTITFNQIYSVNCQERQSDTQKIVNLFINENIISEIPNGQYIANIIIPPKRFFLDENYQIQEFDFDINSLTLLLWAI